MKKNFLYLGALILATLPTVWSLFPGGYFSMHDDQHIVRLYLLDQGISQRTIYPRWVGGLGFGFGYPLFNFYPPLIYYVAEFFHLVGFSLIWSIKLMLITATLLGTFGTFLFIKRRFNQSTAFLGAILFSYTLYHATNLFIRGAFAEYFALSLFPLLLYTFDKLFTTYRWQAAFEFGAVFALLLLAHPLIAFPSLFFLLFTFLFYFWKSKKRILFIYQSFVAMLFGLCLSAFFWLPSFFERRFTLTDSILTKELASYKIHFVYLSQFWYSAWGFGGSIAGSSDGLSFQIGKLFLILVVISIFSLVIYRFKVKKIAVFPEYLLSFGLLFFAYFMSSTYSQFIWDKIQYLWYLQFPWRFFSFACFYLSVVCASGIFFLEQLFSSPRKKRIIFALFFVYVSALSFNYQKYFHPQKYLQVTDKELTTDQEIRWRISKSSFEFVPKGIKTKKTSLKTTALAISESDLPKSSFSIIYGNCQVEELVNLFNRHEYKINCLQKSRFRLNTYNFPGWIALYNQKKLLINDQNDYRLITVDLTKGQGRLVFQFQNTFVRTLANFLSLLALIVYFFLSRYFSSLESNK